MKKMFITALMIAAAATSFAQDITKEMKGLSYAEAEAVVNGAVASLPAEMKAKAYNQLVEIAMPDANKAMVAQQAGQGASADFSGVYNAVSAAIKCDPFDNEPNLKGKVAPKYHKKNVDRLKDLRVLLVVNGQNQMDANPAEALKYFELYINSATSSLFNEVAGVNDPNRGNVSRVVAYLYAQKNDYVTALKYAEIAMADPSSKADTEGIYIAILDKSMQTHEDTLAYINKLKEIDPEKYFGRMVSLYSQVGERDLANRLIDEAIQANPQNKMAWAIKGENAMNDRKWDEAILAFNKTVEVDPSFVEVWFNLGVCASSKGFDLNESLADKQGRLTPEAQAQVTAALQEAKKYYEKVRELDPERDRVRNWPYQLRMVYNALGETDKANEISRLLGEE